MNKREALYHKKKRKKECSTLHFISLEFLGGLAAKPNPMDCLSKLRFSWLN
jgi:hypothetical protein